MFSKLTIFFCFLFVASALTCFYFQIDKRPEDLINYRNLIEESLEIGRKKDLHAKSARQIRKGVQKDIWATKENERTHFCLKSESSDLVIERKNHKLDVKEYLKKIECLSQERIDRIQNTQEIRALSSAEGVYYFPSHQFIAKRIDLFFFHMPGSELPNSMPETAAYLKGKAFDVIFEAENKSLQFTAHHLKANLDSELIKP